VNGPGESPRAGHRDRNRTSDEDAFCPSGSPWQYRWGRCLDGDHEVPVRILLRRDGGRARWTLVEEVA
jgi:hypothetical protein